MNIASPKIAGFTLERVKTGWIAGEIRLGLKDA